MLGFVSFSLIVSLVFLTWAWYAAQRPTGARSICLVAGVGLLSLVISGALFIQSFWTLVFVGFGAMCFGGVRTRRVAVIAAFLLAYAMVLTPSLNRYAGLQLARRQFPIESVTARLAYEQHRPEANTAKITATSLSPAVAYRLTAAEEKDILASRRRSSLGQIHDRSYEAFILAPGFGSGRMGYIRLPSVRLPDAQPIELPKLDEGEAPYLPEALPGAPVATGPGRDAVEALHTAGVDDFLRPDRLGYVKNRDHVVGFQSHQFQAMPELPKPSRAETEWQVVRLELLGLLKGPTPHVYVSEHLPRMDELKDAATRPLNDFEGRSLPKLRTDEDIVVEESPNLVRMLGSLRAGKTCVLCHSVERGELLGAFSYELRRTQPVPEAAKKTVAPSET